MNIGWDNIISWLIGLGMGAAGTFLNEGVRAFAKRIFSDELKLAKHAKQNDELKQAVIKFIHEGDMVRTEEIHEKFFKGKTLYDTQRFLDDLKIELGNRLKVARTGDGNGGIIEKWFYIGL